VSKISGYATDKGPSDHTVSGPPNLHCALPLVYDVCAVVKSRIKLRTKIPLADRVRMKTEILFGMEISLVFLSIPHVIG